ncbi:MULTISPECIES: hypothetical protein [unclassified Clostridium]|nr:MULTISPECIES: hypothetical protein [unclassified Clostridium]
MRSLRDKLGYKEIWLVGTNRYKNLDADLIANFKEGREENYRTLTHVQFT